jgi:hypothetical protein
MSSQRQPRYDHGTNVDTRLSRLETIIDSISSTLDKIQNKLDTESKINWTPIGIGITIFMTVVGSFGTIYTTRMNATDSNLKAMTEATQALAVASTEQRITLQTVKDRQDDFKTQTTSKFNEVDGRLSKYSDRLRALEAVTPTKVKVAE